MAVSYNSMIFLLEKRHQSCKIITGKSVSRVAGECPLRNLVLRNLRCSRVHFMWEFSAVTLDANRLVLLVAVKHS